MTYELNGKELADYQYKYDKNGNITEIKADGEVIAKYTYDSLNQLKTVYDYVGRYYYIYTYDNSGNIIAEHTQRLSSLNYPEGKDFGPIYSYSDSKWSDLLTRFNGHDITYDEIGNPLNYRDGMTMSWNGRELTRIKNDLESYTYAYNLSGLRTSKTVHGTSTNYYYDENNNLISTKRASLVIMFYYDSNGEVYSMSKGDKTYFFIKNLQGDITKIIDEDGNTCATYSYDAWGAILEENEDSSVKGLNPFRYRGYVYDSETGLYYLQSRYYDPQTGRFINADTYTDTKSGSPLSTNMFAYCENNSVIKIDSTGEDAYWLQDKFNVYTAGHTSILIQQAKGKWWYFYWGNDDIQLLYFGSGSLKELNKFLHGYKDSKGKNKGNKWGHDFYKDNNYTDMRLIKGNFYYCLHYIYYWLMNRPKHESIRSYSFALNFKNYKNKSYNLINRNCVEVSIEVLLRGVLPDKKRKILKKYSGMCIQTMCMV